MSEAMEPADVGAAKVEKKNRFASYENGMVLTTSLVISIIAFDRLSTGFIGPHLVEAFGISKTQLGALYSIQALSVAISGYAIGWLSDKKGWRKQLLIPALVVGGVIAVGSLLAQTYIALICVRLLMGAALGGASTLTQSIISTQSSGHRRGLNMGVQSLLMFLIAQMLGPIVFTQLANGWGWHAAYLAPAAPLFLLAVMVFLLLKGKVPSIPASDDTAEPPSETAPAEAAEWRNVWLCVGVSSCYMFWLVVHSTFLPIFLVDIRGVEPTKMGAMLSVLGMAGGVGGLGLPILSDRIGRRAALLLAMGLAMVVPLAALFWTGPLWAMPIFLFIGWVSVGALPIYAIVVPSESVPMHRVAGTIAITIGAGEVVGGVVGPLFAGSIADAFGLGVPFIATFCAAAISFGLVYFLKDKR